jgi:hypothetical protein
MKYFPPKHRIERIFRRPFLIMNEQGAAGSGVSSALEEWIDLTAPKFEPVFSFMTEGSFYLMFGEPGIKVKGKLLSIGQEPPTITVQYTIQYTTDDDIPLFHRTLTAIHRRNSTGEFVLDVRRSSPTTKQFEEAEEGDGLSRDDLLQYALGPLSEIAVGMNASKKEWLKAFLQGCSDTSAKRQLLTWVQHSR